MRIICSYKLLREEIMKRLETPEKYQYESLVLWPWGMRESAIKRILKECCELFNDRQPRVVVWWREGNYQPMNAEDRYITGAYCHYIEILVAYEEIESSPPGYSIISFDSFASLSRHIFLMPDIKKWAASQIETYGELGESLVDFVYSEDNQEKIIAKFLMVTQYLPVFKGTPQYLNYCTAFDVLSTPWGVTWSCMTELQSKQKRNLPWLRLSFCGPDSENWKEEYKTYNK